MLEKTDLEKGLAALEAAAANGNPAARRKALLAKANTGTITAEENDELIKSLRGGSLADEAVSGLQNDELQKSIDVSSVLKEYVGGTVAGLATLADRIEKSEADEHGFRLALAKSVIDMGDVVKSLVEQVAALGAQPARAPKAVGATPLAKSFAGMTTEATPGAAPSGKLSKAQVLEALNEMSLKNGFLSKSGENLTNAVAKYESTNQISKALADEVIEFHTEKLRKSQAA